MPPEWSLVKPKVNQPCTRSPLQISCRINNPTPFVSKEPLWCMAHNLHARATQSYNIIDYLAYSQVAMSSINVLQTCPSQRKDIISSVGSI